ALQHVLADVLEDASNEMNTLARLVILRISAHRGRPFQPNVDGISAERGRHFRLIVDDVSA
ncbi:MAG: hypothetical protein OEV65_17695, partial [Aquincola sp.]|nr:hypothetical protein [Aquincola sp.]